MQNGQERKEEAPHEINQNEKGIALLTYVHTYLQEYVSCMYMYMHMHVCMHVCIHAHRRSNALNAQIL